MVETQIDRKIKKLKSYNDDEYKYDLFLKVCWEEGIVEQFIVYGTPQQNGVIECMNRSLVTKVRCMLSHAGLSKVFWADALIYASHILGL